jgi:hypothetical protein
MYFSFMSYVTCVDPDDDPLKKGNNSLYETLKNLVVSIIFYMTINMLLICYKIFISSLFFLYSP